METIIYVLFTCGRFGGQTWRCSGLNLGSPSGDGTWVDCGSSPFSPFCPASSMLFPVSGGSGSGNISFVTYRGDMSRMNSPLRALGCFASHPAFYRSCKHSLRSAGLRIGVRADPGLRRLLQARHLHMASDVVQTGPREASKPRAFLPLRCSLHSPAVCRRKVRYELRLNQISTGLTNMLHTLSVTWEVNRLGEVAEGAPSGPGDHGFSQ